MATFNFLKMAAAAVFDFRHFQFVTVGTVERVQLHHRVQFLQHGSNRGWHITICPSFQHVARPPSWIFNACVGTTHERHSVAFITVQKLVGHYAVAYLGFHKGGDKSRCRRHWGRDAEGVEARGWKWDHGSGVWRGAVPPPQNILKWYCWKWYILVHFMHFKQSLKQ